MTTDVSRRPRVGSAIDVRVDDGVQIRAETLGIDPRCTTRCIRNCGPGHESTPPNRSQLTDWRAVARHDDCSSGLDLPKYGGRLVAKLSLGDDAALHSNSVASVALRSKMTRRRRRSARGARVAASAAVDEID